MFSLVALSVNGNQTHSLKFDLLFKKDDIKVTKPSFHSHDVLEIFNGILFQTNNDNNAVVRLIAVFLEPTLYKYS